MQNFLRMTFGGLSKQYLFRQLFFGSLFLAVTVFAVLNGGRQSPVATIVFAIISTFLYPYSRFVYERIMSFILGENFFVVNALLMLLVKLITMLICWSFAIFIAPVGLISLYFYHRRAVGEV